MTEDVEVNIRMDKEVIDKLNKMTKKELVNRICVAALEAKVATNKAEILQTKLDKAEAYVEQGRAMIDAIMERWYEYDAD